MKSTTGPTVAAKLVGTNSQHAGIILGIGDSPQQAKSVQVAAEHCLPLLGLHRIIRQGISARDFVPVQSSENVGILYVFPVFGTAELVQKIR